LSSWPKVSKREVRMVVLYMDFSLKKKKKKKYMREGQCEERNMSPKIHEYKKIQKKKREEAKSPNEGRSV
jgi:hypothetical protein